MGLKMINCVFMGADGPVIFVKYGLGCCERLYHDALPVSFLLQNYNLCYPTTRVQRKGLDSRNRLGSDVQCHVRMINLY